VQSQEVLHRNQDIQIEGDTTDVENRDTKYDVGRDVKLMTSNTKLDRLESALHAKHLSISTPSAITVQITDRSKLTPKNPLLLPRPPT
jgi:hypothetical protein